MNTKDIQTSSLVGYLTALVTQYEYIDFGGIAPRVQNRVVKIKLEDIFIPVSATPQLENAEFLPPEFEKFISNCNQWQKISVPAEFVELLDPRTRSAFRRPKNLEFILDTLEHAGYVVPGRGVTDYKQRRPFDFQGLYNQERAVVLGDPGSGKSTLLKYLAFKGAQTCIQNSTKGEQTRIPILVKLGEYAKEARINNSLSLKDFIITNAYPNMPGLIEAYLTSEKCHVLIDGLDEVISSLERLKVTNQINQLAATLPNNRYLVTSRIVGYSAGRLAGLFKHFTLEKLGKESISIFAEKWYRAIEQESGNPDHSVAIERGQELSEAIYSNPGITRLAENPLLLTIIALVFWRGRKLPSRRVELYEHSAETLIESWPFTQRGIRLDSDFVSSLLSKIAYEIFVNHSSGIIGEEDLLPVLTNALFEAQMVDPQEARNLAKRFISQITEQSGIFVERGFDDTGYRFYGFLHLTFAEYFTAKFLAEKWRSSDSFDMSIYVENPRWREVLLLMIGYVGLRDEISATRILADLLEEKDNFPDLHRRTLIALDVLIDDLRVQPKAARYVVHLICDTYINAIPAIRSIIKEQLARVRGSSHLHMFVSNFKEKYNELEDDLKPDMFEVLAILGDSEVRENAKEMLFSESHPTRLLGIRALSKNLDPTNTQLLIDLYEEGNEKLGEPRAERYFRLTEDKRYVPNRINNHRNYWEYKYPVGIIDSDAKDLLDREERELEEQKDRIVEGFGNCAHIGAIKKIVEFYIKHDLRAEWELTALRRIDHKQVLTQLLRHLDTNPNKVFAIYTKLGAEKFPPAFLEFLRSGLQVQVKLGLFAAQEIADPIVIEECLKLVEDIRYQESAIRAICACADISHGPILLELLKNDDVRQKKPLIDGLARIRYKEGRGEILKVLNNENQGAYREDAVRAIGKIGDEEDAEYLIKHANQAPSGRREILIDSLGMLGNPKVIPEIIKDLENKDWAINLAPRGKAAVAIVRIGDRDGIQVLLDYLRNPIWGGRRLTIKALAEVDDPLVTNSLAKLLKDEDWVVRREIARTLQKIGDPSAGSALLSRIKDPDKDVRHAICTTLASLGYQKAVNQILELMEKKEIDDDIAFGALELLGNKIALPVIKERINSDGAYEAMISILDANALEPRSSKPSVDLIPGPWN